MTEWRGEEKDNRSGGWTTDGLRFTVHAASREVVGLT
jgi:hypothetical protein